MPDPRHAAPVPEPDTLSPRERDTPAAGGSPLVTRLRELRELKEEGILSEEEFQIAKERVLRGE